MHSPAQVSSTGGIGAVRRAFSDPLPSSVAATPADEASATSAPATRTSCRSRRESFVPSSSERDLVPTQPNLRGPRLPLLPTGTRRRGVSRRSESSGGRSHRRALLYYDDPSVDHSVFAGLYALTGWDGTNAASALVAQRGLFRQLRQGVMRQLRSRTRSRIRCFSEEGSTSSWSRRAPPTPPRAFAPSRSGGERQLKSGIPRRRRSPTCRRHTLSSADRGAGGIGDHERLRRRELLSGSAGDPGRDRQVLRASAGAVADDRSFLTPRPARGSELQADRSSSSRSGGEKGETAMRRFAISVSRTRSGVPRPRHSQREPSGAGQSGLRRPPAVICSPGQRRVSKAHLRNV